VLEHLAIHPSPVHRGSSGNLDPHFFPPHLESSVPQINIGVPDLGVYDDLITMAGAA
jgi:hypothetical protein